MDVPASSYRPTRKRRVSPFPIMSPLSNAVHEFEHDTRRRFSRGQNPSLTKLLKALDEASDLCDHIGLTLIRRRLEETVENLDAGQFRLLLNQLLMEVKHAERMAISRVRPTKKDKEVQNAFLARARRALEEDEAASKENAEAQPAEAEI